jgi:hypothetical protein
VSAHVTANVEIAGRGAFAECRKGVQACLEPFGGRCPRVGAS